MKFGRAVNRVMPFYCSMDELIALYSFNAIKVCDIAMNIYTPHWRM